MNEFTNFICATFVKEKPSKEELNLICKCASLFPIDERCKYLPFSHYLELTKLHYANSTGNIPESN